MVTHRDDSDAAPARLSTAARSAVRSAARAFLARRLESTRVRIVRAGDGSARDAHCRGVAATLRPLSARGREVS